MKTKGKTKNKEEEVDTQERVEKQEDKSVYSIVKGAVEDVILLKSKDNPLLEKIVVKDGDRVDLNKTFSSIITSIKNLF